MKTVKTYSCLHSTFKHKHMGISLSVFWWKQFEPQLERNIFNVLGFGSLDRIELVLSQVCLMAAINKPRWNNFKCVRESLRWTTHKISRPTTWDWLTWKKIHWDRWEPLRSPPSSYWFLESFWPATTVTKNARNPEWGPWTPQFRRAWMPTTPRWGTEQLEYLLSHLSSPVRGW